MVRSWQAQEDTLRSLSRKERKHGDTTRRRRHDHYECAPQYPDMEDMLLEWIREKRADEMAVHARAIRTKVREVLLDLYPDEDINFRASKGWLSRFLRRNDMVTRRIQVCSRYN
eukprot:scpid99834/ scgid31919/ 